MKSVLYDGRTKTSINNLPEEAWTYLRGEGEDSGLKELQKKVPWLYRGMLMRANSVANVPFAILDKNNNEYDTSDDWENKLEIFPDPWYLLRKTEMAMTLFNYGYLMQSKNKYGFAKELRYLMPLTMKPLINEEIGLTGFERKLRGKVVTLPIEDIIYFWGDDPYVEIGHPQSSPATAALAAAGVLLNVDEFAAAFFERGAIKATVLSVPQGTQKVERDRLKKWWGKLMGKDNAFSTEVLNADAVTATTIGEGIEGLENTTLTKDKKEDVSTALGIALSKMFPTSATDSNRVEDEKSYLQDTILPQTKFYEGVINKQILKETGYRWKFQPEKISILQEDEGERSIAFKNYTDGGLTQTVAAAITGVVVPEGFVIEDKEEPEPIPFANSTRDEKEDERGKFHRYMKNGKDADKFTFNVLPIIEQELLKQQYTRPDYTPLVKSLTEAVDAVRNHPVEHLTTVNVENIVEQPELNVKTPEVVVNVPEQEPDTIIVKNEMPEQKQVSIPAPIVNVENIVQTPEVNIENIMPPPKKRETKVKRDHTGKITGMETK